MCNYPLQFNNEVSQEGLQWCFEVEGENKQRKLPSYLGCFLSLKGFLSLFIFYQKQQLMEPQNKKRASKAILGSWLQSWGGAMGCWCHQNSKESSQVFFSWTGPFQTLGLKPGSKSVISNPSFGSHKDVSNGSQENLKVSKYSICICIFFSKIKYIPRGT